MEFAKSRTTLTRHIGQSHRVCETRCGKARRSVGALTVRARSRETQSRDVYISPISRELGDHAVFMWGAFWACLLGAVLIFLWVTGHPWDNPLFALMVSIGVFFSSFLMGLVSRIDTTLVLSAAPALLFILLESTNVNAALALWGTAYFFGLIVRFRHIGDAAETTAYILGAAIVAVTTMNLLNIDHDSVLMEIVIFLAVYILLRLAISSIRLSIVVNVRWIDTVRELLPSRIALFSVAIAALAWLGHNIQHLIYGLDAKISLPSGGAAAVLIIGFGAFGLGIFFESQTLRTQLQGTLQAALELPWGQGDPIEFHAVRFTRQALPRYTIELRRHAERNVNEIVAPILDGFLVARRGSSQSPFLTQDQRILDSIAHIADTMSVTITERESLAIAATTDDLTGLPNYRGFHLALSMLAPQMTKTVAIAYIDLDGFKEINDSFGHEAGNAVLRTAASRMRRWLPESDLVARIGGDEFVLILTDVTDEAESHERMKRLLDTVSRPVVVGDVQIPISLSHGIAFSGTDEADLAELVVAADRRMYEGRGRKLIDAEIEDPEDEHPDHTLNDPVASAIRAQRLTFVYQPIVDHVSNQIVGLEALVRPGSELLGISPESIVEVARRLGLLTELSTHMIDTTIGDMGRFRELAPDLTSLHVNIDIEQVTDPDFISGLKSAQTDSGVDVTLELGERSLGRITDTTASDLESLKKDIGIRVALDDFGRKSSTMRAIMEYPLDVLKIDKAMTKTMSEDKSRLVMKAIADLANALNIQMVVEGIEDENTFGELVKVGVRYMQGYRFGVPLTAEEMTERLSRHGLRGFIA